MSGRGGGPDCVSFRPGLGPEHSESVLTSVYFFQCRQCYGRRRCYPPVRRWVLFILPGALIALTGLITFAFFETDRNYKYTHSVWHACIALCIVFILPPRQPNPKDGMPPSLNLPSHLPVLGLQAVDDLDSADNEPSSTEDHVQLISIQLNSHRGHNNII